MIPQFLLMTMSKHISTLHFLFLHFKMRNLRTKTYLYSNQLKCLFDISLSLKCCAEFKQKTMQIKMTLQIKKNLQWWRVLDTESMTVHSQYTEEPHRFKNSQSYLLECLIYGALIAKMMNSSDLIRIYLINIINVCMIISSDIPTFLF